MMIERKGYHSIPFFQHFSGISVVVQCGKWFSVSRPEGKMNSLCHKSIPFLIYFYYHFEDQVGFDDGPLASVSIKIFWISSIASTIYQSY